jgi:antitoxin ParD1/3/4
MNISLTTELDNYVHQKVQSGLYHSASEVIREGLRLLKEQDALKSARLAQFEKELDLGIKQIESGEYIEVSAHELPQLAETIKADGRKRRAKHATSKKAHL